MAMFQDEEGKISTEEYLEIIRFFDKNLVVGAELERTIPLTRQDCARTFNTCVGMTHNDPTLQCRDARARSEYNIANVSGDGTIEYGNELIFSGNAEGFHWNHDKLKLIEDKISTLSREEFNAKNSTHISVLTATNTKLSPLIVKNIFNIARAYSSALYWLGSGSKHETLHRGTGFCNPNIEVNPKGKEISLFLGSSRKYSHVNLGKQPIVMADNKRFLNGLFVEFRNVDGIRVPSAVAALMMLHKAIAYKAVEYSTKGLVSVEELSSNWAKNKQIMTKFSARLPFTDQEQEFMASEAHELIGLLSPYLKRMDEEVIIVLENLAIKPVSIRHRSATIKEIERDIYVRKRSISKAETKLLQLILDGEVQGETLQEWKESAAKSLGDCSVRWIEKMLNNIIETERINFVFDEELNKMRLD
jgi:hypothetical protein